MRCSMPSVLEVRDLALFGDVHDGQRAGRTDRAEDHLRPVGDETRGLLHRGLWLGFVVLPCDLDGLAQHLAPALFDRDGDPLAHVFAEDAIGAGPRHHASNFERVRLGRLRARHERGV
ncbi:hypothetical protein G6F22_019831 [Rhizopus arrhizus]|nr:hypothetical protein G6F22_019831 [Rhizopus arrhizus]